MRLDSPGGGFVGSIPLLLAQVRAIGALPVGFPGVNLDPFDLSSPPVVLFNGAAGGTFGFFVLPAEGFALYGFMPGGLGGLSVFAQGLALSGTAANGIFASTDSSEIVGL